VGRDAGGRRLKSSQDDDLAARFVFLRAAVRLDDVIELEDPVDLGAQRTRGDLLDQFVERCQHKVLRPTVVGRQAHGSRDHAGSKYVTFRGGFRRAIPFLLVGQTGV